MDFVRSVTFSPAFDKRNPDPTKNYGIHGVEIRFVLRGPKGATQFLLSTNWQLPHVTKEFLQRPYDAIGGDPHWMERPMPADLGYHSYTPQYDGQPQRKCDVLPETDHCYYDGSTLMAEPVYHRLLAEGDAGVWSALEAHYHRLFDEGDNGVADHPSDVRGTESLG
jgi:hypothetical protein